MVRRFVDLNGAVLAEEEWSLNPTHTCFYCDKALIMCYDTMCPSSQFGQHEFITLCREM